MRTEMLRKIREAKPQEGFTLIELLIVIVVLGILAGIVVLGVGKFQEDATAAACGATKDNIQIAADAWATKNAAASPAVTVTNALVEGYLKPGTTINTNDWTLAGDSSAGVTVTAKAGGNCV